MRMSFFANTAIIIHCFNDKFQFSIFLFHFGRLKLCGQVDLSSSNTISPRHYYHFLDYS